jgi:hypothetical protein
MTSLRRLVPTPSMAIACCALLIVLGGTGYAAVQALPRNSVTTVQVKDHSLLARDFKAGQIPRGQQGVPGPAGPQGPAGPTGPAGAAGAGARWALVRPDGGIAAQSGGITLAAHPSSGNYFLSFPSAVNGHLILAAGAYAGDSSDQRGETTAGPCAGGTEGRTCPTGFDTTSHVWIQTRANGGSPADHSFYIAVFG